MAQQERDFKGISQQVESEYSENARAKQIPQEVLDRYLTVGNGALFKCFDATVSKVSPAWLITQPQMLQNIKGMFVGDWPFSDTNRSIYWVFWGPLTLVFFSYLLHSAPFQNHLRLTSAGLIDLGLILLLGFALFVYSNVMHFPHDTFRDHICVSSHICLLSIIHCCVNVAGPDILVIPMSLLYVGLCTYLHFQIYNRAIKPTLIEFIILFLIVLVFYSSAAYLFYTLLFKTSTPAAKPSPPLHSLILRSFNI